MDEFIVNMKDTSVKTKIIDENTIQINSDKKKYNLIELSNGSYLLQVENKIFEASLLKNSSNTYEILVNNKSYSIDVLTALQDCAMKLIQQSDESDSKETKVKSPMPGLVLKINKKIGDQVASGETIMVLEAMKMENEIKSPRDGELVELFVKPGSAVEKNILLFGVK
jgi:biotin carboxyl carrier protein